jgi:hypothetical protein
MLLNLSLMELARSLAAFFDDDGGSFELDQLSILFLQPRFLLRL